MFVQVIEARCTDPAGVRKQWERWQEELKPGSIGFLGSTGGVAEDGTFIVAARFESQEAAKKNSDRPEQGKWWSETEGYLQDVKFTDCTEIDSWATGGSDDAGFVQIMQGRATDLEKLRAADKTFEEQMPKVRPDIIGGYQAVHPDGSSFTSVNYFTSEAEARQGEKKELPQELQKAFSEWQSMITDLRFIDLKEPWLSSK
jgi:hypothetical protein